MTMSILSVLAAMLLGVQARGQSSSKPHAVEQKNVFANNLCFSKGGLGIINSHLYIVVEESRKNELLLPDGRKWTGKDLGTAEVVIYFGKNVWSPARLPAGFDLSKAVIVSFEGRVVRFFEFSSMSGGYYERLRDDGVSARSNVPASMGFWIASVLAAAGVFGLGLLLWARSVQRRRSNSPRPPARCAL